MYEFSTKMQDLEGSAIRAVLKMAQGKDLITFAAGIPALETLPVDFIKKTINEALETNPGLALQYGVTDGYNVLVERLQQKVKNMGMSLKENGVMVTSGGQQVIDLLARSILNEGDVVLCELPTFIGGLNVFKSYNANVIGVPLEKDGINLEALEKQLKENDVKLLYTIPTFHNPMGTTMSELKRKAILALAHKYDFLIIEDNPYGELRFGGEEVPTMKSLDAEGRVIYAGSFSKILSPGLRVGFAVAPKPVLEKMVVAKQVIDVHTTMLSQIVAAEFLAWDGYDAHIKNCCDLYKKKSQLMAECIDRYLPEYVTHTNPNGGIFMWCDVDKDIDTKELLAKAVEKKVAYIPGYTFMIDTEKPCSSFRLNYSIPSEEDIIKGIEILGEIFKNI